MSQRSEKKNSTSTLAIHSEWHQLMLDYWVCWGCAKRCGVTLSHQPNGCLSSIKEENKKASLKIAE